MFDIYIKDFNQNGNLVTTETLVQSIPSSAISDLKLISPTVKCDMGNAESFTFNIEAGTKFYDAFNQMKTFMRVVYDGDTIFYGRVLTIENSFYGTRKLRLEGPLAFLNDSSIEGVKEESRIKIACGSYLERLLSNHNTMVNDPKRSFNLGEVPGHYSSSVSAAQQIKNDERKFGSDSWQDTKGAVEDLRSHYGGYLRVRCPGYKSNNTYVDQGHYIDWMDHYFSVGEISQTIEVGKNVIDLSTSTEIDNIFTVVIPIGNSKSTSYETADGEKKATGPRHFYVPGREVTVPSICQVYGSALNSGYHTYNDYATALDRYGRIIKTVAFDDAENESELLSKCQEWIKNNYQGEVTKFSVKAVDMHQIGDKSISKIMVGDQVRIIYPGYNENGVAGKASIVRTCLSVQYDLYNPENNTYTFGIPANILTKSYGLTKQSKSTKSGATTPKSSGSGASSSADDRTWLNKVTDWLAHHKIRYKRNGAGTSIDGHVYPALFPWKDAYKEYEKGPSGYPENKHYFYSTEITYGLVGRFTLWKFTPKGEATDFNQAELDRILRQIEESMITSSRADINKAKAAAEKSYRSNCTYTEFDEQLVALDGTLTVEHIAECRIIDYVKQEYGIDLTTFGNVKMPDTTVTTADGDTIKYEAVDSKIVTTEMILTGTSDTNKTFHIVPTNDGRRIGSMMDENGEWHYYMIDPKDPETVIPATIRDLKLSTRNSDTFLGSMVTEKLIGTDMEAHTYLFGQGIENWANGELVVAKVDGDILRFGSNHTQWASVAAQKMNGIWLNPIEHVLDEQTGQISTITIGTAGHTAMKVRWDETKKTYVYDENGTITLVGSGIWDTDNLALKGGIYTVDKDGEPVTYINSNYLVLGNSADTISVLDALRESGVIDKNETNPSAQSLVAKSIYTLKVNAIDGEISRIKSDYLETKYLTSQESALNTIYFKQLWGVDSGYIRANQISSSHIYYRKGLSPSGGDNNVSLASGIRYVQVIPSGDDFKLQYQTFDNDEWQDPVHGTFNRAATIKGVWAGSGESGTYTITPTKGKLAADSDTKTTIYLQVEGAANPNATVYAKVYKDNPNVSVNHISVTREMLMEEIVSSKRVKLSVKVNSNGTEGWVEKGSVSTANTYTAGYNSAHVTGSWDNNKFTYSKTTSGSKNSDYLYASTAVGQFPQDTNWYVYATTWNASQTTPTSIGNTKKTVSIANKSDNEVRLVFNGNNTNCTFAHNKYTAGQNSVGISGPTWDSTGTDVGSTNHCKVVTTGKSSNNTIHTYFAVTTSGNTIYVRKGDNATNAANTSNNANIFLKYDVSPPAGTLTLSGTAIGASTASGSGTITGSATGVSSASKTITLSAADYSYSYSGTTKTDRCINATFDNKIVARISSSTLKADNIKKDVTIFGVKGTYVDSTSYNNGWDAGYDVGYDAGYDEGWDIGYDAGSAGATPPGTLFHDSQGNSSNIRMQYFDSQFGQWMSAGTHTWYYE